MDFFFCFATFNTCGAENGIYDFVNKMASDASGSFFNMV